MKQPQEIRANRMKKLTYVAPMMLGLIPALGILSAGREPSSPVASRSTKPRGMLQPSKYKKKESKGSPIRKLPEQQQGHDRVGANRSASSSAWDLANRSSHSDGVQVTSRSFPTTLTNRASTICDQRQYTFQPTAKICETCRYLDRGLLDACSRYTSTFSDEQTECLHAATKIILLSTQEYEEFGEGRTNKVDFGQFLHRLSAKKDKLSREDFNTALEQFKDYPLYPGNEDEHSHTKLLNPHSVMEGRNTSDGFCLSVLMEHIDHNPVERSLDEFLRHFVLWHGKMQALALDDGIQIRNLGDAVDFAQAFNRLQRSCEAYQSYNLLPDVLASLATQVLCRGMEGIINFLPLVKLTQKAINGSDNFKFVTYHKNLMLKVGNKLFYLNMFNSCPPKNLLRASLTHEWEDEKVKASACEIFQKYESKIISLSYSILIRELITDGSQNIDEKFKAVSSIVPDKLQDRLPPAVEQLLKVLFKKLNIKVSAIKDSNWELVRGSDTELTSSCEMVMTEGAKFENMLDKELKARKAATFNALIARTLSTSKTPAPQWNKLEEQQAAMGGCPLGGRGAAIRVDVNGQKIGATRDFGEESEDEGCYGDGDQSLRGKGATSFASSREGSGVIGEYTLDFGGRIQLYKELAEVQVWPMPPNHRKVVNSAGNYTNVSVGDGSIQVALDDVKILGQQPLNEICPKGLTDAQSEEGETSEGKVSRFSFRFRRQNRRIGAQLTKIFACRGQESVDE